MFKEKAKKTGEPEIETQPNADNQEKTNEPTNTEKETEQTGKRVSDTISEIADKIENVAKEVFEKVKDFTSDATELTKLKVDIHKLKNEHDKQLRTIGEKLWDLKKQDNLKRIGNTFSDEFLKLEELEQQIKDKEAAAGKINLSI